MNKKRSTPGKSAGKAISGSGYPQLVTAISALNTRMAGRVAMVANQVLVLRNWTIGAYIIKFEQDGADRAEYGERLLEKLAADLKARGLKGLDQRTLRDCRRLSQVYPQIRATVSPESELATRRPVPEVLPTSLEPERVLQLSWSKLQELIRIDDPWKRAFFENETLRGYWSVRQLQRQIGSLLYERTGLSTDKKAVIERARKQEPQESLADTLRDPYILEFTGLADRPEYSEDQMESALLDHLQRFLLELGRGFCFEARQFRMTEGRKHHRVDLVFTIGCCAAMCSLI